MTTTRAIYSFLLCLSTSVVFANTDTEILTEVQLPQNTLSSEKCLNAFQNYGFAKNSLDIGEIENGNQQIHCTYDDRQLNLNLISRNTNTTWAVYAWENWKNPFIVALYRGNPKITFEDSHCTGVVVSRNQVITAAHCYMTNAGYVRSDRVKPIDGSFGTDLFKIISVEYVAKDKKLFPIEPRVTYGADLAIITIGRSFPDYVSVGQIINDHKLSQSSLLQVTGYGKDEFNKKNIKKTADIKLFDKACLDSDGKPNIPSEYKCVRGREFVAGNAGTGADACKGDSGGPVFMLTEGSNWGVLGIVSRGADPEAEMGCGKSGSIYTSLTPYANYLQSKGIKPAKTLPNKEFGNAIISEIIETR